LKWDLDERKPMWRRVTRRLMNLIEALESEGSL